MLFSLLTYIIILFVNQPITYYHCFGGHGIFGIFLHFLYYFIPLICF